MVALMLQEDINLTETIEKEKRAANLEENFPRREKNIRPISRNLLVKKQMAEQLMAKGLSKESISRILHLRLKDE